MASGYLRYLTGVVRLCFATVPHSLTTVSFTAVSFIAGIDHMMDEISSRSDLLVVVVYMTAMLAVAWRVSPECWLFCRLPERF